MVNEKARGVSTRFLLNAFLRQILDMQTSRRGAAGFPGVTISLWNNTQLLQTALFGINLMACPSRHSELIEQTLLCWVYDVSCQCFLTPRGACNTWAVPARTTCWPLYSHQGRVILQSWASGSWPWLLPFCCPLAQASPGMFQKAFVKLVANLHTGRSDSSFTSCLAGRDPWPPLCC